MSVFSDSGTFFLLPFHLHQDQESLDDHVFDYLKFPAASWFLPCCSEISVGLLYRFIDTARTEKNVTCLEDLSWSPVDVGECSGIFMK